MKRLIIIGVFMVYSCVALSQGNQEELRKSIYWEVKGKL